MREAVVKLTNQIACRLVKIHHASGRCFDAHFVLDRSAAHTVALTCQLAVFIDEHFRYEKQGDAARACGGIGQFSENQMNNVFGKIMLTCRNENFGTRQAVAAIGIGHSASFNHAEVGTCVRFGETHGACPDAFIHFW